MPIPFLLLIVYNVSDEMRSKMHKKLLQITDNAAKRIKELLAKKGNEVHAIKVSVKTGGCSGLSYVIDYAEQKNKFDELVEDNGVKVIVDAKALMYLVGTEMDFVEDKFNSTFVFNNPNEKNKCGCGKSFGV